jgi:CPA2 family monovalent cation:H+ antiporter-2
MVHLPPLILDLCLILAAAGLITLIFKKIKQPLVLGYIIAGLLVGPHISIFPTVIDEKNITIWAEIGVIFLLFSLGLEFSFKKLVKVGGAASITAVIEAISMLGFGFITGLTLGWSTMDSIFLGGILSISSTTIIIRAFDELGVKTQKFAGLVFGVLIVEDLVAILLLVLLSTLAVSQQFSGAEMLTSVLKLGFFLVLWFVGGIFLIPTFLKRTRNLMNDETLLIVSIALCLLMVVLATTVGFSPALGAFIMGSILAETAQGEKIEHLVKSVKDLFAAIFFVSVGMLINPALIMEYIGPILLITVITIVGKFLSSSAGALLSGQPLRTSIQTGMSLAQIGEFSFIIATLGLTLKVTSDFLYPIAVAVSALTTFTTPYMIKLSDPMYSFIERKLPKKWLRNINLYSSTAQVITTTSDWKKIIHTYVYNVIIHSVIITFIIFISTKYFHPFIEKQLSDHSLSQLITVTFTLLFMAPFIWALSVRRIQENAYSNLWQNRRLSRGPLIGMEVIRVSLGVVFTGFLILQYFSTFLSVVIALALIMAMIIFFARNLQLFYNKIERRFLTNLNDRESESKEKITPDIVPWDAHLVELIVSPEASIIGKSLEELAIRETYGVNIARIERGNITIPTPGRGECLYPGDEILVIGTDEQLALLRPIIEIAENHHRGSASDKESLILQKIDINSQSPLKSISIRLSGIREKGKALIVGVERNGVRILNPDSSLTFEENDIVWIVGNPKRIKEFLKSYNYTPVVENTTAIPIA